MIQDLLGVACSKFCQIILGVQREGFMALWTKAEAERERACGSQVKFFLVPCAYAAHACSGRQRVVETAMPSVSLPRKRRAVSKCPHLPQESGFSGTILAGGMGISPKTCRPTCDEALVALSCKLTRIRTGPDEASEHPAREALLSRGVLMFFYML